jgi:hypothetical protein
VLKHLTDNITWTLQKRILLVGEIQDGRQTIQFFSFVKTGVNNLVNLTNSKIKWLK